MVDHIESINQEEERKIEEVEKIESIKVNLIQRTKLESSFNKFISDTEFKA